jgi:hypothetical protein
MKAKSKEIKDLLEDEPFLNLRLVQEKILELNFPAEQLDSYRKVLNEEMSDDEQSRISEFLINSMEKIYSSPLENISKHPSGSDEIEISLLEKVAKIFR